MKSLPIVALIGQTNAGKSSLLNRFARKNIAIVAREEGTTRDNVITKIDDKFLLIDTAGLKDPSDDFEANIQDQISDAIEAADVILVTLDSSKYPDQKDKEIAKKALKSKKPVFLVLNKSDLGESLDTSEFRSFGIKESETFRTSATTGQGIKHLKEHIEKELFIPEHPKSLFEATKENSQVDDEIRGRGKNVAGATRTAFSAGRPNQEEDMTEFSLARKDDSDVLSQKITLALIGRPNVGKSSLFNSLGKKQQAIVSSRQGTTRDINRLEVKYKGKNIEVLDTAGLRKPGKREVGIEKFSALRTLAAIEEADVCALLIDGTEPHSKLDQALAGEIIKAGKGIVVVVTKTDLIKAQKPTEKPTNELIVEKREKKSDANEPQTEEPTTNPIDDLLNHLEYDFNFLPFAPVLLTSSKTGDNVTQLFELTLKIAANRTQEIKTSDLNKILNDAILAHKPAGLKNTHPKPKYVVQTDTCPPWFVVHGHDLGLLHWSWKRFLERKIREQYPFVGTPIFFSFHSDNKKGKKDKNPKNSKNNS